MNNRYMNRAMLVAMAVCCSSISAKAPQSTMEKVSTKGQIVAVDSIELLHSSQEGQVVTKNLQAEIDRFTQSLDQAKLELDKLEKDLKDQEGILSTEALEAKKEEVKKKQEECDRTYAQREMKLRETIQRQQMQLRDKQMAVMNKVMEEKEWAAIVDKNTPGVLCVAKSMDVTDMMLKAINVDYEKSSAAKLKSPESTTGKVETEGRNKEIKVA